MSIYRTRQELNSSRDSHVSTHCPLRDRVCLIYNGYSSATDSTRNPTVIGGSTFSVSTDWTRKLLSFVDQCFLYVILDLEKFPPNYLALLPRQIRKELLLSLPMVDICNLEETVVVEGIEMNDVWQNVCENRVTDHVHLHPLSKVLLVGGREFCFRALIFLFVHFGSEYGIEAIDFISLLYSVKLHMGCSAGKTVFFSRINSRSESLNQMLLPTWVLVVWELSS